MNFRSSQHICNVTSKFSAVLDGKQPTLARGEYADFDTKPILLQFKGKNRRENVVSWFKQLCDSKRINPDSDSVAILTRGRILQIQKFLILENDRNTFTSFGNIPVALCIKKRSLCAVRKGIILYDDR